MNPTDPDERATFDITVDETGRGRVDVNGHDVSDHVTGLSDIPTAEEIAKVRRYECVANGHSWHEVMVIESADPVRIVCTNCGRSCRVLPHTEEHQ